MSVPMLRQNGAPVVLDRSTDTALKRANGALERHPTDFRRMILPFDNALCVAERAALTARLDHLRETMHTDPAVVRGAVAMMRGQFPTYGASAEEVSEALDTWTALVRRFPPWAVAEAVERFLGGRVPGADHRRGPTLPEFCRVVNQLVEPVTAEIVALKRVLGAEVEAPIDPALQARAKAKAAELIAGAVAARVVGRPEDAAAQTRCGKDDVGLELSETTSCGSS